MSSSLSTVDSLKNTASSAYETVANSLSATSKNGEYDPAQDKNNVGKDAHGNKFRKGDFKDQLNQAAYGGPPEKEESFTEKAQVADDESVVVDARHKHTTKVNSGAGTRG
ncbi:predicted protein [Sclerotinia sclerotiorum 1980 UF-70]|uniref:Uncharacterized protein n=1 Tax=Sclerotinia sclerotiorum (strain ATCC 18683 / 1980 / Ss-1) TaxID=665079 RepID=A7F2Q3_SCLS1|nr:predicted protein [Sclerotinia sclerotiorum 1980 UF-70]EDN95995.1 predicted protein [Sclerotinia sclerotiorum 1980 UF-70]